MDSPKNARLEDQRAFRVPAALNDPYPEVRQSLQKPMCPAAIGEVIERQVAGSNPEVEPLPFGILSGTNPTIKVGAIILMDGIAIDIVEPTVSIRQPLQPRVLRPELCISAVTWHKVPMRLMRSPIVPTCVSRRTGGGVQVGVGNAGAVAARIAAGTNIQTCVSPQVPPAKPSMQTVVPTLAAEAATPVCKVLSTARKCKDVGARWATP